MKRLIKRFTLLIVLSLLTVFLIIPYLMHYLFESTFGENLLAKIYDEDTVYAEGYTADAWDKLKTGDSATSVIAKLGMPITTGAAQDGEEYFFYSELGDADTSYRMRIVVFNSDKRISRIITGFYVD